MRVILSAGFLLGLVAHATAAATIGGLEVAAKGRILVRDRFLDDNNRAALLCRAHRQSMEPVPGTCRRRMSVPRWFSNSVLSLVDPGAAMPMDGDGEVLLPITEAIADHREHQDQHVVGDKKGGVADARVGVVYLEGDGDFVLKDATNGAEHRVPIEPGKLIAWPNADFTHRVESSSRIRRMLGPMTIDASSGSLVGVGSAFECTNLAGYECVDAAPLTLSPTGSGSACSSACFVDQSVAYGTYGYGEWNGLTNACSCYASASPCTLFVSAPGYETWVATFDTSCPALVTPSPTLSPTLSPTPAPVTDPIHIAAASFNNRASVRRGMSYALKVTLTMPALVGGRRLIAEDQRELQGANSAHTNKKPLNATDYALFVTVPRGGAVDMLTYRRTVVRPQLKPASLKKPQVQSNGDLLWSRVPMLRYMTKAYTRTFKVVFKVTKAATSPLVFGASVWKDDVKLYDASPVTVTVLSK